MVTGINKGQFKEFYETIKGGNYKVPYQNFMAYPFEMQIGVYLAYYDSMGYFVNCESYLGGGCPVFYPEVVFRNQDWIDTFEKPLLDNGEPYYTDSRNEAYKEAFKKANDLINKK